MKKKVDISIVLPVYNEEVILERSVLDLYSYLKNSDLTNNFEIVLCLNGCTDKSVVISNKLSDKLKEVCVLISKKKGVGVGILLGLKKARYEYILTMGVDIPFGLSIIEESICAIQKTCADIIIQSKNHSKSNVKGSFKRKFFSFCYNKFINLIYDLHIKDTQGPFLIRKNSLNKIILFINSSTSFIKTQILIYSVLFNMKMVEIPVNYVIRSDSKINFFIEGLKMFFESLKEFFKFGNVSIIKNLLRYDSSSYNYPLSNVTTLKIGGNATFFFKPRTINDIKTIILFSKKNKIPLFMLGAGSNVLFCDDGFNGVVVSFEKQFSFINKLSDEKIEVGGGTLVSDVLSFCFENDFGGLEFLSLIPGTIGGIVSMNAGAFEEEIGTYVFEVKAIDLNGKEFVFSKKAADFSYRSSIFLKKKLIITSVVFNLKKNDKSEIKKKMFAFSKKKKETQPLLELSAGCIFKNHPNISAGELIEKAGLKGLRIGDAQVSKKHANFIINKGSATSKDVSLLIKKVRADVYKQFGVRLELELIIVDKNGRYINY